MRIALISFYSRYYEPVAPGLAEEKKHLHEQLETALRPLGEVRAWPLVESEPAAAEVGRQLAENPPDVIIALPTVAVFAALLESVVQSIDVPIILLNLEDADHPFDLGRTRMSNLIQHSHGLAIQAFSNVLMRAGRNFEVVTARLLDPDLLEQLRKHCVPSNPSRSARPEKLGLFGHVFESMRDVVLDRRRLEEQLGLPVQLIAFPEIKEAFRAVSLKAVKELDEQLRRRFQVAEMPSEEWTRSLRLACAYRALCEQHQIAGGALNSHGASGLDDPDIGIMGTLALSLLTETGVSLAEVGDLQTGVALYLARRVGAQATYTELDFVDRKNDRWFIANSGELDLGMADPEQPIWIRSNVNFRGRCGGGAAFDAALRPGPATLFSFTEGPKGSYRLIVAQGELLPERSEVLQLVNGTFRPAGVSAEEGYRDWCAGGAVHHAALSPGHIGRTLRKLSETMGIDCRINS